MSCGNVSQAKRGADTEDKTQSRSTLSERGAAVKGLAGHSHTGLL